jgi:hypothetical protein
MLELYGNEYYIDSNHFKQQMLDLYGCENYTKSEHCKQKMLELYGTEYYIDSNHFKQQMLDLYGCDNYTKSEHCKQKMLELYGTEYYIHSETFHQTMTSKYGFPYALQNSEIFSKMIKSSFTKKDYTFPKTRRTVQIMGYEPRAIDYLLKHENKFLKRMIEEDEILIGDDIPTFLYKDDDNRDHIYYPDIYIKDTKLIYEVKSDYVFSRDARKNYLKFCEVAKRDYVLKVLIFDDKKLLDIWTFKKNKKGDVVCESMICKKKDICITFDKPLCKKWYEKKYIDIEFVDEESEDIELSEEVIDELCVDIIEDMILV